MEVPQKPESRQLEEQSIDGSGKDVATKEYEVNRADPDHIESAGFDEKATKKLIRKIDWFIIPWVSILYLLSFIDRTNIGNARLGGLEKTLGMKGLDFNVALAIFFPFYVLAEVPSNIILKRTRPSIWIPSIMVAWAIVCTLMGVVSSYGGLLAARAVLGLTEGGLFPGVTFYITCWYCRHEVGFRMAVFFSAATIAGAFGGLLARGLMEMDGIGGKRGWQWIFIIEGLLTFVIAVAGFFVMNDYPATAKFLTPAEKAEISRRLEADSSSLADEYHIKYVYQAFRDWKIWITMVLGLGSLTPVYVISLYLPTLVKALGYTNNKAQLMTVPPYVVACVVCIAGGYFADKQKTRGVYYIGFNLLGIVGFSLLMANVSNHAKYAGSFFAASGVFSNIPNVLAWGSNNMGGTVKRAVGMALLVGFSNLGGLISSFIIQPKDAPRFLLCHGTMVGLLGLITVLSSFLTIWLRRENVRRDQVGKRIEDYTQEELDAERELGDYATYFRYTV